MTEQEINAGNFATMRHIENVRNLLNVFVRQLLERGEEHDQSKLEPPEAEAFAQNTPQLASSTYGSEQYNGFLKVMDQALVHHYAKNRHHPQHHKNGIADMNLVDIVEMFCDWKAASMRHHNGNILKSIEANADRFGMSPQLVRIFENTAVAFEGKP